MLNLNSQDIVVNSINPDEFKIIATVKVTDYLRTTELLTSQNQINLIK